MNRKLHFLILILLGSILSTSVQAQILISGFMANPPTANDAPYEYVQLIATQNINFATTNYSMVWANNGTATSIGWVQGGAVTYGFNLTSGSVNKGDVFYVGGDGKMIYGAGSTDISTQKWIRAINTSVTTGDGFGANGTAGQMGNGGVADGLAVFAGTAQNLTASSIPIDAVFYGTTIGLSKPTTGGYTLPDNDRYINSQGTFGNGTNTFMMPTASNYIKLIGTYFPATQKWNVMRTGKIKTLTLTSPIDTIATGIILDEPKAGIYLTATKSGASYINQNTTNNILQTYRIEVKNMSAILDTLKIKLGGTFAQSDFNSIKLIYSQDAIYQATDVVVGSKTTVKSGILSFDNVAFKLDSASIGFLLITVDAAASAANGNTIIVDSAYFKDFIFKSANFYGIQPLPAGGLQTIAASAAANIKTTYLNDFGSVGVGNTSAEQSFTISGSNLSPASGNIMVIPSSGFRVSFTSGSGYSSTTITKAYTASTLSAVNVYVVFTPSSYKTVSSSLTIGGGGASQVYVPVSGTGVSTDHSAPVVDTAYAVSSTRIKVVFSEAVSATAEVLTNYQMLANVIASAKRTTSFDTVYVTITTPLQPAVASTLLIRNVQDTCTNHNVMPLAQTFQVKFGSIVIKNYTIKEVSGVNATTGVADSLNVYCRLNGVIQSPNFSQSTNNSMFYIHDNSDGILINRTGVVPVFIVRRGDKVRVVGRVQQTSGLIRITPDSIVVIDSFQQERIPTVTTKLNENTEAEVIRLNNLKLINPAQWPVTVGTTARIVSATNGIDTFTINIFVRCPIQGTPAPTGLFDIVGLGSQNDVSSPYTTGYTIWPRDLNDLFIHPPYPTYSIAGVHSESPSWGVADSIGVYCKLIGVVHGSNESSTGLYFTIIDHTGGIKVFSSVNLNPPYTVTEGDEIAVIGTVQQYFGLTEIFPDTIQLIATGQPLTSPIVTDVLDETTESKLVQINNLTIVPPSQWPITPINNIVDVEVTDGVHNFMVRINKNCDIQGTPAPTGKFNVTGLGWQYDQTGPYTDNYYIVPRNKTDIGKANGVNEASFLNDVNLFPNPSNGSFFVQNESKSKLIIEILNTLGQSVYKTRTAATLQQIDLTVKAGLYLVKLTDENTLESKTIKLGLK